MELRNIQFNSVRTHDSFYANVDPFAPPKDSFIQVGDLIGQFLSTNTNVASIIDIGCATGAFLNYLGTRFPEQRISGYEYLDSLVKAGRTNYPNVKISQASLFERDRIAPPIASMS